MCVVTLYKGDESLIKGIAYIALVVRDYEEAMQFYCDKLGFIVAEDTQLNDKRWIRLRAPGGKGSEILLSKARNDRQQASIGNQTGGRVLFFFHTDDFDSDYKKFRASGIEFVEGPREEPYGKVAVFKDLYGNRIDLIQPEVLVVGRGSDGDDAEKLSENQDVHRADLLTLRCGGL